MEYRRAYVKGFCFDDSLGAVVWQYNRRAFLDQLFLIPERLARFSSLYKKFYKIEY